MMLISGKREKSKDERQTGQAPLAAETPDSNYPIDRGGETLSTTDTNSVQGRELMVIFGVKGNSRNCRHP